MLLIDNFRQVTAQIENERGIAPEVLISAIEQALVTACKKKLSEDLLLEASIDTNTGEAKIFQNASNMVPPWFQNVSKLVPTCFQNDDKIQ